VLEAVLKTTDHYFDDVFIFKWEKVDLCGQALDCLFIDGDHSYPGVKCEFEMYGPMVTKGGLIAFHDIVEGGPENVGRVPRFWRGIKLKCGHIEIIKDHQQGGHGIGVLYLNEQSPVERIEPSLMP
jgi:hypothetical protein